MVRASISVALGGIARQLDPLGQIYGWFSSVHLLGSVTQVPYLVSLSRKRDTEKLKPTEIALNPSKHKLYKQQDSRYVDFILMLLLFFRTILYDCYIPIQTLIITLLHSVMLRVPKGA